MNLYKKRLQGVAKSWVANGSATAVGMRGGRANTRGVSDKHSLVLHEFVESPDWRRASAERGCVIPIQSGNHRSRNPQIFPSSYVRTPGNPQCAPLIRTRVLQFHPFTWTLTDLLPTSALFFSFRLLFLLHILPFKTLLQPLQQTCASQPH
jgi:hypothetical protein